MQFSSQVFQQMKNADRRGGFTLLELSMVLIILAMITYMSMTSGLNMLESAKRSQTNTKLDQIEQSLMAFRTANNRLPCPSDESLAESNTSFGVEAVNAGSCTTGSTYNASGIRTGPIAAPTATYLDATNNVVEGAVPFLALGLPKEFMYDGWGRRFSYAVGQPLTGAQAMRGQQLNDQCNITISNAGAASRTVSAAYALVSYGSDGHGGYLSSGGRRNALSSNSNAQTNCHCTSAAAANVYSASYVMRDASVNPTSITDQFSGVVRFKDRWQLQTPDDGYGNLLSVCLIPNANFELPQQAVNGATVTPTGGSWSFSGTTGVAANGSTYTSSNPNAPMGAQVAFVQTTGSFTQTPAYWPAGNYQLNFYAAQQSGSTQSISVSIDGTNVVTVTPASTSYQLYTTNGFTLTAGSHSVQIQGNNSTAGSTALVDAIGVQSAGPMITNPDFETPTQSAGGYTLNPSGASWTFTGNAGISANGSGFTTGDPNTPYGAQVAVLQNTGSMSQAIASWTAGTYKISFSAIQRLGYIQSVKVTVDGVSVGTFTPATTYQTYTTSPFQVTAGSHTLALQGLSGGSTAAFIDAVRIVSSF